MLLFKLEFASESMLLFNFSFSSIISTISFLDSTSMLLFKLEFASESMLLFSFSFSSIISTICSTFGLSRVGLPGPILGLGRFMSHRRFGFSGVREEDTEIPLELYMSSKNCALAFFCASLATTGVITSFVSLFLVPFSFTSSSFVFVGVSFSSFEFGLLSFTNPFFFAQFLQELVKLVLRLRFRGSVSVFPPVSTSFFLKLAGKVAVLST